MIRSFADAATEQVFQHRHSRRYAAIERVALRKLRQIHAVAAAEELHEPPGNRLERLKGDRAGLWSIRINGQWRITFHWTEGRADHVAIIDYH